MTGWTGGEMSMDIVGGDTTDSEISETKKMSLCHTTKWNIKSE